MGRNRNPRPRNYSINQAQSKIKNQESAPTEQSNINALEQLSNTEIEYYGAPKPKVAVEKSIWEKIVGNLNVLGAIITIFTPIAAIIFWLSSLYNDVQLTKDNVTKNENDINENTTKIINIEKSQIKMEKDIDFLKQNQSTIGNTISNDNHPLQK